jgi:glyoxylase I family protein
MIDLKGVVHFSIPVSDLAVSRTFYTEIVGLKLVRDGSKFGMVFLQAGDDHVILAKSEQPITRSKTDSRRAHHAFKVDAAKYDAAKAFITSQGVEIFEEEDRKTGVFVGRQCYLHDPDGNVIEISEWDGTSVLD